jgi:hypothetical protein
MYVCVYACMNVLPIMYVRMYVRIMYDIDSDSDCSGHVRMQVFTASLTKKF